MVAVGVLLLQKRGSANNLTYGNQFQIPIGGLEEGCEEDIKINNQSEDIVSQYLVTICAGREDRHQIRVVVQDKERNRPRKVVTTDIVLLTKAPSFSKVRLMNEEGSLIKLFLPENMFFREEFNSDYNLKVFYTD